jgi:hypothetical protein
MILIVPWFVVGHVESFVRNRARASPGPLGPFFCSFTPLLSRTPFVVFAFGVWFTFISGPRQNRGNDKRLLYNFGIILTIFLN